MVFRHVLLFLCFSWLAYAMIIPPWTLTSQILEKISGNPYEIGQIHEVEARNVDGE